MRRLFLIAIYYGGALVAYVDPFYGVLMYTFMNIVRPEQLAWGDQHFAGRIFLIMQAACFTSWLFNKEKLTPEDTVLPRQVTLMIIVAVGMIVATIFATGPTDLSWKWTTAFMKTTLFCFVITKSINTTKKLELYYVVLLFWFMFLEAWGIQQKLGGNVNIEGIGGDQLSNRNDLSAVVVLYFPMAYYSMFSTQKWIKYCIGIPATIISAIFILFAGSRGAFLGLIASMALIFLQTPGVRQKFKMLITMAVIGGLFAAVIIPLAPEGFFDEYTERLRTLLGEEEEDTGELEYEDSAAGRLAMWKAVYYLMKQHPEFWLTGMGLRGFSAIYIDYFDEIVPHLDDKEIPLILYGGGGGKAIHNTYLNIATSGGIIVFLPWMLLLFFSWFQAHNIPKKYPRIVNGVNIHNYALAIKAGLVGAGLNVMFINAEFVDFYYWQLVMIGVLVNLGKAKLKRERFGQDEAEEDLTDAFDTRLYT
ncbi:MAG: O-antigen ligase family protein [Lentisphaerae bacterium]|nr:O-antigen ligase family protein [Lentisphaerota bacterium]